VAEFNKEKFKECWRQTEVIREYHPMLFTFGDTRLPYVFAAEHTRYRDRTLVRKGIVVIHKPHILVPGYSMGPEFGEGFEHANAVPAEAAYLFRTMGLPYSQITNRPAAEEGLELGSLSSVLQRIEKEMTEHGDMETGLIKGRHEGADVSLMRYSLGLVIKSAPGNVQQFFEHVKRQRGEPMRPHERITDEEIRRLFE
jgi:alpha-L-fucosidase